MMTKLLLLFCLVPNIVMAQNLVLFHCVVQHDEQSTDGTKGSGKALEKHAYEYNPEQETLKIVDKPDLYSCLTNNWVITCQNTFENPTHLLKETIEIGRKDLRFHLYRNEITKDDGNETKKSQYVGSCRV